MSNLNYARNYPFLLVSNPIGIRNSQKKSDSGIEPKNLEFSAPLEINPSTPTTFPIGEKTPFPSTSVRIESSKLKNLFGENVHMDNLNYINDMLQTALPEAMPKPQRKKKGKEKNEDLPIQAPMTSPEKANVQIILAEDTVKTPTNIASIVGDQDSSLLNVDEPNPTKKNSIEKLSVPKIEEERLKLVCERNMSSTLPAKDTQIYAECFQTEDNENMKRSMSVADIRTTQVEAPKASGYGKSNYYAATGMYICV